MRAQVKAKGEAEALRDTYLFERATAKTLRRAYNDLGKPVEKRPNAFTATGFPASLANIWA